MMLHQGCQTISVTVNGDRREVPAGLTLLTLLEELSIDPQRVAIEFNREIVRQPGWASTPVEAGSQIEIVQFVGGG